MKNFLSLPFIFLYFFTLPFFGFSQNTPLQHSNDYSSFKLENDLDSTFYPSEDTDLHENEADTFQAKFQKMLFILGCLIVFMIIAAWSLKRMMKTRLTNLNATSFIKIIETRSLSPRSTLYLIDVDGQTLLIAETASAITHLPTSSLEMSPINSLVEKAPAAGS